MFAPLKYVFDKVVRDGDLRLKDASGALHRFGNGRGPRVDVTLADKRLEKELVLNPQLALGEAYMRGRLTVEHGSIYDFLEMVLANAERHPMPRWLTQVERMRRLTKRVQQLNTQRRSRQNVAHHYDIDASIYRLFLDADRQYSCAYFGEDVADHDLEAAQLAKKRHIAAKLMVRREHKVLDIGSGWGGLGLYLNRVSGADVTGITLSEEQLKIARERVREQGASAAVRFNLQDYRATQGRFDRIVSVGMFEHVGVNHYDTYFKTVRSLLADDGVALVHSIGRSDEPAVTNQFIAKYIFPGGYIPALSEVLPSIERAGLIVTDVEVLRLHYAKTLRLWRERFLAERETARQLRGEEFCRMWEFYLAGSETAFRHQGLMVFQIQLAKRVGTLPLTRDYMMAEERRLREIEAYEAEPRRLAGE